LFVVLIVT